MTLYLNSPVQKNMQMLTSMLIIVGYLVK